MGTVVLSMRTQFEISGFCRSGDRPRIRGLLRTESQTDKQNRRHHHRIAQIAFFVHIHCTLAQALKIIDKTPVFSRLLRQIARKRSGSRSARIKWVRCCSVQLYRYLSKLRTTYDSSSYLIETHFPTYLLDKPSMSGVKALRRGFTEIIPPR